MVSYVFHATNCTISPPMLIRLVSNVCRSEELMNQFSKRARSDGTTRKKATSVGRASADVMRAHIALLDYEIIESSHALFSLVSYYYPTLQQWHSEHTGWRIEHR